MLDSSRTTFTPTTDLSTTPNCLPGVRDLSIAPSISTSLVNKYSGDLPLEQEAYSLLPGLSESEPRDITLGVVLDSLLPFYKEVISPTPLPTFLGTTPFS